MDFPVGSPVLSGRAAWRGTWAARSIAAMSDSIFLVGDDGSLAEMTSAAYDTEADLQKLLADNIHLLPGAQIDQDSPRRWLLVKREAGIPDREGGGGLVGG